MKFQGATPTEIAEHEAKIQEHEHNLAGYEDALARINAGEASRTFVMQKLQTASVQEIHSAHMEKIGEWHEHVDQIGANARAQAAKDLAKKKKALKDLMKQQAEIRKQEGSDPNWPGYDYHNWEDTRLATRLVAALAYRHL
jgi:hypothetical protein